MISTMRKTMKKLWISTKASYYKYINSFEVEGLSRFCQMLINLMIMIIAACLSYESHCGQRYMPVDKVA